MKISVIVPVYGVEKYIRKNIVSLLEQKYEDLEFVFVDDCSKDRSMDVLNAFLPLFKENSIKIIRQAYNQGVGAARLAGLINSTGDYIWFVDSDDWINSKASIILSKIIKEYKPDIIQFSHIEKTIDKNIIRINNGVTLENLLWLKTYPALWRNVFRREFLIENDIYPVAGINYAEDFEMLSRAYALTKDIVLLSNAFLYNYNNTNVNSYTHNIDQKSLCFCIDVCNSIYNFYESKKIIDSVKSCFIYVYLRWFIEISNKDNKYSGMNVAYNNIMNMYPKLFQIVNRCMKYKQSWLLLFLLRIYRFLKFNVIYKLSSYFINSSIKTIEWK